MRCDGPGLDACKAYVTFGNEATIKRVFQKQKVFNNRSSPDEAHDSFSAATGQDRFENLLLPWTAVAKAVDVKQAICWDGACETFFKDDKESDDDVSGEVSGLVFLESDLSVHHLVLAYLPAGISLFDHLKHISPGISKEVVESFIVRPCVHAQINAMFSIEEKTGAKALPTVFCFRCEDSPVLAWNEFLTTICQTKWDEHKAMVAGAPSTPPYDGI